MSTRHTLHDTSIHEYRLLAGIRQYQRQVPGHALVQQVYSEKSRELMRILSAVDFKQCLVFSNYQMRYWSWIDILSVTDTLQQLRGVDAK